MVRIKNPEDFLSGLMFIGFGVFGLWFGRVYDFGTVTRMGPGFFPTVLSVGLIVLGAIVALRGVSIAPDGPVERLHVRPLVLLLASVVLFAVMLERFGLAPTTFVAVLAATFAYPGRMGWLERLATAFAMAVFAVLVFKLLLGHPIAVFRWF